MRKFIYLDKETLTPVMVSAKRKPSIKNVPCSGTWVLREYYKEVNRWDIPCFPEITWNRLSQMTYIGEYKINDKS